MREFLYAVALRCIGQDLELRGLKTFDLVKEGRKYIVQCGYQMPPSPTPVTLHYTEDDIEQLDRAGEEKRGALSVSTEFLTLPQLFRAIGGFLDKNGDRLIRITNNNAAGQESMLRVEYENADREHVVDNRPVSAIYDMCVTMYKQRGKAMVARRYARRGR